MLEVHQCILPIGRLLDPFLVLPFLEWYFPELPCFWGVDSPLASLTRRKKKLVCREKFLLVFLGLDNPPAAAYAGKLALDLKFDLTSHLFPIPALTY